MKLIRKCSFIFRLIDNSRHRNIKRKQLFGIEIQNSIQFLIKKTQEGKFSQELAALRKGLTVPSSSKFKVIDPFLDKNGLLRVCGTLINSNLSLDAKHNLILPSDQNLTKLIFEYIHKKYLHIGAQ